ncbi:MAG: tetratricopeptide repeat protein [candidate division WOR-3 bacterium]
MKRKIALFSIIVLILLGCVATQPVQKAEPEPTEDAKAKALEEYSIGYEYLKQGKYDEALLHFNEAIKLYPKYYAAYIPIGQIYRAKHEYPAAESVYNYAKKIDPKDTRSYEGLAAIYIDQKKYGEAISEYLTALQFDSTNVNILNGLGFAYTKIKDYDKALSYYFKALKFEPDNLIAEVRLLPQDVIRDMLFWLGIAAVISGLVILIFWSFD